MLHAKPILAALILMFIHGTAPGGAMPDRAGMNELLRAERWDDIVAALTPALEINSYHGEDWLLLGLAHSRRGDCKTAAPLFTRAIELGANGKSPGMMHAHVEAAHCAAQLGDLDAAVEHLAIAQERYEFADFERFSEDPRFERIVQHPVYRQMAGIRDGSTDDRIEGWSADLDYFVDLVERRHPDPFHTVESDEWYAAVDSLRQQLSKLGDLEVAVGFMRLAGMINDGHTSVYPPFEGPLAFHLTPIWPYAFGDEWRVIAAAPEFADVVGARIVAVEGVPIAVAAERIAAHLPADNSMTRTWMINIALQFAEVSQGIFGAGDSCCLSLDVELETGERRTVRLPGGPIDRDPMSAWAPAQWPSVQPETPPAWLTKTDAKFWYEEADDLGLVFAQINQVRNDEAKSFADFGRELRRRMTDGGFRHLVLDLRHNNGGNGYLNWPFVRELVRTDALDHPDGLFVITGRRTFSAAMLLASMLEFHTDAIFVGEPTGSSPQFYGEDTEFRLPFSGLTGSISSRWFQNRFISDDERPWIAPDIVAVLTIDDLREGRDPALRAIRQHLESRSAASVPRPAQVK